MKKLLIALLLSLLVLPPTAFAGDYVIGEGDGLDILVWGVKELNSSVKVRPDGKITIPGIGDIVAAGLTPPALQLLLTERLKELVKSPNVTVTVRDITNSKVYIFGGGIKSGVYDLNRRTTLLQLLCTIGDIKSADLNRAYVLRKGSMIKRGFSRLFIDGDTSEDIVIETNDSIYIPPLPFASKSIYVLGAVNQPRSIEYREGITVLEAVLEAGGFNKFAKQNDTTILRKLDGKEAMIPARAKDVWNNGDMTQNIALRPGDYVIVKESMF